MNRTLEDVLTRINSAKSLIQSGVIKQDSELTDLLILAEENARLKAELAKRDCVDGTTHNPNCYDYGRRHYDCALSKIKQLEAELAECKRDSEKYVWADFVTSTLDEAMSKGGGG